MSGRRVDIGPFEALDVDALARLLAIPIVGLGSMEKQAPAVRHLMVIEPEVFSAVTVLPARGEPSSITTVTRSSVSAATSATN